MLIAILLAWVTAALGLWIAANTVSGVRLASFGDALWAGAILGILQWLLTTFLFVVFGLATLGIGFLLWFITRWIVLAVIIRLTAGMTNRLTVEGFFPALLTGFIVALTGTVLRWLV